MDKTILAYRAPGAIQLLDFRARFCIALYNQPVNGHSARNRRGHRAPDQILAAVYVLRVNVVIDVLVLGPGPYLSVRARCASCSTRKAGGHRRALAAASLRHDPVYRNRYCFTTG